MTKIKLPYGKTQLILEIPKERLKAILISGTQNYRSWESEVRIIQNAFANPIASAKLTKLAIGKKKISIISSDHTRPMPSCISMPLLLNEIRKGNPKAEITILVATGLHRLTNEAELKARYGEKIYKEEKIMVHDSRDEKNLVSLGELPSGCELIINKLAVESDLLIAEGLIEPHFFAGFSGGYKSILPGIASKKTVLFNHCSEFIAHNKAKTGILEGNPIHKEMLYAAEKIKLDFIINVVINDDKKVINAFAGHWKKAHEEGCRFINGLASVSRNMADIVITTNGGYPLDQNIYQSVKCMTAAEANCKEGGVIIIASECTDGHGGEVFFNTFARARSPQQVIKEIIASERNETITDQWESQILARVLNKFTVIMVTDAPREIVEKMHMRWAIGINEALKMAEKILANSKASITVIPDGVSVIVN